MIGFHPKGTLIVGLSQIAPAWLDRAGTLSKILDQVDAANAAGYHLVAFGEGLLPRYPFWIERTNGAVFTSTI